MSHNVTQRWELQHDALLPGCVAMIVLPLACGDVGCVGRCVAQIGGGEIFDLWPVLLLLCVFMCVCQICINHLSDLEGFTWEVFQGFFNLQKKTIKYRFWLQKNVIAFKSLCGFIIYLFIYLFLKRETICSEATGDVLPLSLGVCFLKRQISRNRVGCFMDVWISKQSRGEEILIRFMGNHRIKNQNSQLHVNVFILFFFLHSLFIVSHSLCSHSALGDERFTYVYT